MILGLGIDPILVTVTASGTRFTTRVRLATARAQSINALATCIGLPIEAIRTDHHAPITAGLGTEVVLVELAVQTAVAKATSRADTFRETECPGTDRLANLIYTRDGFDIRTRVFQHLGGIPEDPATGSTAAVLTGYRGQIDGLSATFHITQGAEMSRPSKITTDVAVENAVPTAVSVEGQAIRIMEGGLTL
jgi:trans-2,3-dihydro-3-hydroxyanthranilate isomerase